MSEPKYRLEGIVHTRDESMEDFEGPLDVIFLLLSKNKIDIEDVSITAILEQYLAYLDEMKRLDMEIASEFITMASHLMLIKTKMLLSSAEAAEAEETPAAPQPEAGLSADAQRVLASLGGEPKHAAVLEAETGLSAGSVLAALTELELLGKIRSYPGQRFTKSD